MKKAVLFDLDNTLYNYDKCHKIAMDAFYKEFKKESDIERDDFEYLFSESRAEIKRELIGTAASHSRVLYFQRLTEKVHKTVTPERIFSLYNTYWDTLIENATLFDGVIDFFKDLKAKGIKVIIITNLTALIQIKKIIHLGISDYVDFLVTSEEAGYDKPHPAPYLLALHKANLLPEEVIMVGDNMGSDVDGAEALGIDTVLYNFGSDPDYVVNSHEELRSLFFEKISKE